MDRDILLRKLDSLSRCIRRIESKRPRTIEELNKDIDLQDILSVNLERAVQLCVDIGAHVLPDLEAPPPKTMGEVFGQLAERAVIGENTAALLRQAVGFRNLSVHSYDRVDWQRVFEIIHQRLDDFRAYSRTVTAWMERQQE